MNLKHMCALARALKSPASAVLSTVAEVGAEPYLVAVVR